MDDPPGLLHSLVSNCIQRRKRKVDSPMTRKAVETDPRQGRDAYARLIADIREGTLRPGDRLTETDLEKRILGCGDGPAAFNAGLTRRGGQAVSIDPVYAFTAAEIRQRIDETYEVVLEQARSNLDDFAWTHIHTPEELGRIRMKAMEEFLADYPAGCQAGRYVAGELPALPFPDGAFDLALCSHLLFLYGAQLSEAFHIASVRELCRVAAEVRIFPLVELGNAPARHLGAVTATLEQAGFKVSIETVPYEFQRGGNRMMRICRTTD